jgi:hypothetical protein
LALVSCRSLGATYDESRSLVPSDGFQAGSVAVIGPPAKAQFPGLAETLGEAIRGSLGQRTPSREFVSASDLYARLQRHKGYYQHFGAWLSRYTQTGFLETEHLAHYAQASGVRYLLILRDAAIKREKMDVRTAADEVRRVRGCRLGCVGNANNIFRNQLIVLAEVIDLKTARIAWKGVGDANIITSRMSKLDFGLVQYNLRQPGLGAHADQLVAYVANGIADEISGSAPQNE